MKSTRRTFLADLLFLGGGLTASALLVNFGGQGCGQSISSNHVTQGVVAPPDAVERLKAIRARPDILNSPAPEPPAEAFGPNNDCSDLDMEHSKRPGHGQTGCKFPPFVELDESEMTACVRLRW